MLSLLINSFALEPEQRCSQASLKLLQKMLDVTIFLLVGNKPKERISKRVFQKNKARQIPRKTNLRVRIRG